MWGELNGNLFIPDVPRDWLDDLDWCLVVMSSFGRIFFFKIIQAIQSDEDLILLAGCWAVENLWKVSR